MSKKKYEVDKKTGDLKEVNPEGKAWQLWEEYRVPDFHREWQALQDERKTKGYPNEYPKEYAGQWVKDFNVPFIPTGNPFIEQLKAEDCNISIRVDVGDQSYTANGRISKNALLSSNGKVELFDKITKALAANLSNMIKEEEDLTGEDEGME